MGIIEVQRTLWWLRRMLATQARKPYWSGVGERHSRPSSRPIGCRTGLFPKDEKGLFYVTCFAVLRITKGMDGPGPTHRVWTTRRIWEGR
jgi:hypothetical protein